MQDENNVRKLFVLFEEKARELYESRFSKNIQESSIKMNWERDKDLTTVRVGPDYEAIKSFVITFRNFILNSDTISIENISKIYEKLDENDLLRIEFSEIRKKFNDFLNSDSIFVIKGEKITNFKLVDTYIYGDVTHLKKHHEFKGWIDDKMRKEFIFNDVVYVLIIAGNFIYYFKNMNKRYADKMFGQM